MGTVLTPFGSPIPTWTSPASPHPCPVYRLRASRVAPGTSHEPCPSPGYGLPKPALGLSVGSPGLCLSRPALGHQGPLAVPSHLSRCPLWATMCSSQHLDGRVAHGMSSETTVRDRNSELVKEGAD